MSGSEGRRGEDFRPVVVRDVPGHNWEAASPGKKRRKSSKRKSNACPALNGALGCPSPPPAFPHPPLTRSGAVHLFQRQGNPFPLSSRPSRTYGGLAGLAESVVREALHQAGLADASRADDDHLQLEVGRPRRLFPSAGLRPRQRGRDPGRAQPASAEPRPPPLQPRARLHPLMRLARPTPRHLSQGPARDRLPSPAVRDTLPRPEKRRNRK